MKSPIPKSSHSLAFAILAPSHTHPAKSPQKTGTEKTPVVSNRRRRHKDASSLLPPQSTHTPNALPAAIKRHKTIQTKGQRASPSAHKHLRQSAVRSSCRQETSRCSSSLASFPILPMRRPLGRKGVDVVVRHLGKGTGRQQRPLESRTKIWWFHDSTPDTQSRLRLSGTMKID